MPPLSSSALLASPLLATRQLFLKIAIFWFAPASLLFCYVVMFCFYIYVATYLWTLLLTVSVCRWSVAAQLCSRVISQLSIQGGFEVILQHFLRLLPTVNYSQSAIASAAVGLEEAYDAQKYNIPFGVYCIVDILADLLFSCNMQQ